LAAWPPLHVKAAQGRAGAAPPAHAKPAAQGAHASAAPEPPFETNPGAQAQELWPPANATLFAGQGVQAPAPAAEKLPGAQ